MRAGLERLAGDHPTLVKQLTGRGLLVGLHLDNFRVVNELVGRCIEKGLLVAAAFCNGRCVLIEPPLTIDLEQLARGVRILEEACHKVSNID